ncbi:MAG TPA: mechanosensitive ion channel domain-containing protein [Elusimicrobiota bacterium]|nr:mechanosensitive ion channel domain-containing protein [Elusimicrobiota bacterium]
MRTAKTVLALLVSASLAAPASAQVRAAASIAGSALPRVPLAVPAVSLSAAAPGAPLATALAAAPSFAPSAFAVPSAAFPGLPAAAISAAAAPAAAAPALGAAAASPAAASSPAPALAPLVQAAAAPAGSAPAASALEESASIPAASLRTRWESFWSGSASRPDSAPDAATEAAVPPAAALARPSSSRLAPRAAALSAAGVAPVAAAAAPAAHGVAAVIGSAAPYLEAGGMLVGAYFLNRAIHAVIHRYAAKRGMDRQTFAAVRLVAGVAVWTAAAAAAMVVGGASHSTMTAALGAAGTILTLGLKDALGNLIQGVNFLLTRPFKIGSRVQIDDQAGTVSDANLTNVIVRKDDGSEVKIRHSALAAKPVTVFGAYSPDAQLSLKLAMPARPKFRGALGAVWGSLDRRFWLSAAAFAALAAAPHFVPFLAGGGVATAVRYALAASAAWLTRRVSRALGAAVDHLAAQNAWSNEAKVIARLAVSTALWVVGGGAALRMAGVTWTALAASLGLTTLGIGFAANNFLGSIVQGGQVLFSKPFKVGDRVQIGAIAGAVEDMTLYHVVIKLDEGRHVLVPYAVVRDATLVVTPAK